MPESPAQAHWQRVYTEKAPTAVSWFQPAPTRSLGLIERAADLISASSIGDPPAPLRVIDVGGGASTLVDALLDRPRTQVCVVDIAAAALQHAQVRLGEAGARVRWVEADVTGPLKEVPTGWADVWHDRAVFHFLTTPEQRLSYACNMDRVLAPCGVAIIATFAPDGPERCSGLPVCRHDAASIAAELSRCSRTFAILDEVREDHTTPWGSVQKFTYAMLHE